MDKFNSQRCQLCGEFNENVLSEIDGKSYCSVIDEYGDENEEPCYRIHLIKHKLTKPIQIDFIEKLKDFNKYLEPILDNKDDIRPVIDLMNDRIFANLKTLVNMYEQNSI